MKIKLIAILIVLLAVSSTLNVNAETMNVNQDNYSTHYFENFKNGSAQHDVKTHRQIQINFEENVGIAENNDKPTTNQPNYQSTNKQVNISETLSFNITIINQNIVTERLYTDNVAIPERILNSVKIRSDGKTIQIDESQWSEQSFNAKLGDSEKLILDKPVIANVINNIDNTLNKILSPKNIPSMIITTKQNDLNLLLFTNSINHDVNTTFHHIADQQNQTLLVLLIPLSGYILLRTEEVNLNVFRSRQFFSFCLIVLPSSSMSPYDHTVESLKEMRDEFEQ
jgi:hypothetical protein